MSLTPERREQLRRRNRRALIVGCVGGGLWGVPIISQFFWPAKLHLRLAQALHYDLPPRTEVFVGSERGLVVHETFRYGSGGLIGKLTFLDLDGETRSTFWERQRSVLGVTGPFVWTDAPRRPSFRLPDLTEGPEQRPLVARCVSSIDEVTVHPSGVFQVLTSDGQLVGCTADGERVELPPAPMRESYPPYRIVDAGGAQRRLEYGGRVLAEGLLRPLFAADLRGGLRFVDGDALVLWRAEMSQFSPLRLSRFSPTEERWTSELGRPDCRVRSEPHIARFNDRLLVVGRGPHGGSCAAALRFEDGAILWSRDLPPVE